MHGDIIGLNMPPSISSELCTSEEREHRERKFIDVPYMCFSFFFLLGVWQWSWIVFAGDLTAEVRATSQGSTAAPVCQTLLHQSLYIH
jgi:hypothetical protein